MTLFEGSTFFAAVAAGNFSTEGKRASISFAGTRSNLVKKVKVLNLCGRKKSQNVDFLIVKGNEYWEKRAEPENAVWARNFLLTAHQLRPQDEETGLLYSRSCFFVGKYIEQNKLIRDSLFMEGALTALSIVLNIDQKELIQKQS